VTNADTSKAGAQSFNPKQCPCCKKETMETVMRFNRRGPPVDWKEQATDLMNCIRITGVLKNEAV